MVAQVPDGVAISPQVKAYNQRLATNQARLGLAFYKKQLRRVQPLAALDKLQANMSIVYPGDEGAKRPRVLRPPLRVQLRTLKTWVAKWTAVGYDMRTGEHMFTVTTMKCIRRWYLSDPWVLDDDEKTYVPAQMYVGAAAAKGTVFYSMKNSSIIESRHTHGNRLAGQLAGSSDQLVSAVVSHNCHVWNMRRSAKLGLTDDHSVDSIFLMEDVNAAAQANGHPPRYTNVPTLRSLKPNPMKEAEQQMYDWDPVAAVRSQPAADPKQWRQRLAAAEEAISAQQRSLVDEVPVTATGLKGMRDAPAVWLAYRPDPNHPQPTTVPDLADWVNPTWLEADLVLLRLLRAQHLLQLLLGGRPAGGLVLVLVLLGGRRAGGLLLLLLLLGGRRPGGLVVGGRHAGGLVLLVLGCHRAHHLALLVLRAHHLPLPSHHMARLQTRLAHLHLAAVGLARLHLVVVAVGAAVGLARRRWAVLVLVGGLAFLDLVVVVVVAMGAAVGLVVVGGLALLDLVVVAVAVELALLDLGAVVPRGS
ncbi:hypothetical protein FOA52_007109 [Chlamydomonas sp. UWO 241]|nr:hypothetical protein FOA52_007109 [Chlamydomonas sp. UWO 241]